MVNLRREKLLKTIVESPDMPVKEAMILAGYSEAYAGNSHQLTHSGSFRDQLDGVISNSDIVATLNALINRREWVKERHDIGTEDEKLLAHVENLGGVFPEIKVKTELKHQYKELSYYFSDATVVLKASDTLFKIRGDYAPEKYDHNLLTPFIKSIQENDEESNGPAITGGEHYNSPVIQASYRKLGLKDDRLMR